MLHPYLRLIRFDRPIGSLLLLWPTLWSLFIASHGKPPVYAVVVFTLGVLLTRSAGCAINDYADFDIDKQVARTKDRPLANGSITKKEAFFICLVLSIAAFILAYVSLKPITLYLSVPALLLFISYPFMKRFFAIPQVYLGIAYSFGILMAFVEVEGNIPLVAVLLFIANLFWVVGYDTIYALVDLEDDLKIGIKTSAIFFGKKVVASVCGCYVAFLLFMAYIAHFMHLGVLFWILWLYAAYLLVYQVNTIYLGKKSRYFEMFLLNNRVGYVMFAAVLLGGWV